MLYTVNLKIDQFSVKIYDYSYQTLRMLKKYNINSNINKKCLFVLHSLVRLNKTAWVFINTVLQTSLRINVL